jgi:hypothetical protein
MNNNLLKTFCSSKYCNITYTGELNLMLEDSSTGVSNHENCSKKSTGATRRSKIDIFNLWREFKYVDVS